MNFRLIQVTKRPVRHMLLRRDVDEAGKASVVSEVWIDDYTYSQTATFDSTDAALMYIETFSDEAGYRFFCMARDQYKADNPPETKA